MFAVRALLDGNAWRAGIGGALGMAAVLGLGRQLVGEAEGALLVASMGASAVLLFVVPKGPLSTPWALLGGHGLSALVGVLCARWVHSPALAAALAVGLAIWLMYVCRCTHPPGGATALSAVIGGQAVHSLGLGYVLTPVLANAATLLCVATLLRGLPRAAERLWLAARARRAFEPD